MEQNNFPLVPYNDFPPKSRWTNYYYKKNMLNNQMVDELTQMVETNYEFEKGKTGVAELGNETNSYKTNNRDIAYIYPQNDTQFLYNFLFPIALEANDALFHFDIDIVTDPIHYVIYPEDGGHLDWHMDVSAYGVNKRKLAMTVQLSDSKDYEGGDFEIWGGGKEGWITVPREKGDIIVFPSFLMHRVKPITKGERRCLVFWTGGRPFR